MATEIVPEMLHPLQMLTDDSELALALDLEDPMIMSEQRLAEVIQGLRPDVEPQTWGYFVGLLDQRRFGRVDTRRT